MVLNRRQIEYNGKVFNIFDVPMDGSCMFYSLSKVIFGDINHATYIRESALRCVIENWDFYGCRTEQTPGKPYANAYVYGKCFFVIRFIFYRFLKSILANS